MGAITQQPQGLIECIARLEKQNRVLKRVGLLLFFLCFLAIGLIGWQLSRFSHSIAPQGEAKIISATQFNLTDQNGKLQGVLAASPDGAMLFLNGSNNKLGLMFNPHVGDNGSSLSLTSGEQQVTLATSDHFSSLTVGTMETAGDQIDMHVGGGEKSVSISDKAGFRAILGSSSFIDRVSGESINTSAAALSLFGKDGHLIWTTPRSSH